LDKSPILPPNFSVEKAHKTQALLSKKIIEEDKVPSHIRYIAGVDVAYSGRLAIGSISLLEYESLRVVESKTAICETRMPYVPTLLAFREIPAAVACIKKVANQPDVLLVDGHGIAHPYNFGFASHLGAVIGKPTIGVAKKNLVGQVVQTGEHEVVHYNGKIVGSAIRRGSNSRPIYVSVGNLVSLERAIEIVNRCTSNTRIPEPLRQAHKTAVDFKKELDSGI
jgi:deoxyribonuclease V